MQRQRAALRRGRRSVPIFIPRRAWNEGEQVENLGNYLDRRCSRWAQNQLATVRDTPLRAPNISFCPTAFSG
jgi:hypothetical protein